jgi:hypothetical protein
MTEVVRVAGYSRVETPCQRNPDLFFADSDRGKQEAKKICATCGVRDRCFNQAKEDGEKFGVWGGVDFSKEEVKDPNKCQKGLHRLPKDRVNNRCERCAKDYKKAYNAQPHVKAAREESNRKRSRARKNRLGGTCHSGQHVLTKANTDTRSDGALMCLDCYQSPRIVRFRNDKGVRDGYGFGTSQ